MKHSFSVCPTTVAGLRSFEIQIPQTDIANLNQLLQLSRIARPAIDNSGVIEKWGVSRDWLITAVWKFQHDFDWRFHERRINDVPNFKLKVEHDESVFDVHFAALFSKNPDAIPIVLLHGWPGSFLEFLPILEKLQAQYASDPASLPYHIIVPSLPGFGFSQVSDKVRVQQDVVVHVINKLMIQLGFAGKYIAQGGDVGSELVKKMILRCPEVKAAHFNMHYMSEPDKECAEPTEDEMAQMMHSVKDFQGSGMGYAMIHATKPSTIGLVVGASPVSLLAW